MTVRRISIRNISPKSVRFDYISGSSLHFHASFFAQKLLDAGESTTFDVAFLPRHAGVIRTQLVVNTSIGQQVLPVVGRGLESAYALRSAAVDVPAVALNGSMTVPIRVHNPHGRPMRIVEMFTSGGDLHLETPLASAHAHEECGRMNMADAHVWVNAGAIVCPNTCRKSRRTSAAS